ncbi:hypothetical protein RJT34_16566 [Clitoria ternatea]|uniref:Uncharacterized protein n=1 Tax=Clitoria ternatea TaxID=43366 RepID=A0AAN9J7M8_CLITE
MATYRFSINLNEAHSFKGASLFLWRKRSCSKTPVYAIITVGNISYETPIATYDDGKLKWEIDSIKTFYLLGSSLQQNLKVTLVRKEKDNDKVYREVSVPLKELFDNYQRVRNQRPISITFPLLKPSDSAFTTDSKKHGYISFTYEF